MMKINPTLIAHPRVCLLHALLSDRYGHTPFELQTAQVMLDMAVSLNTVKRIIAQMEAMHLISQFADGKYVLRSPVDADTPAPPAPAKPKPRAKAKATKPADGAFVGCIDVWHQHLLGLNGIGYKPSNAKAQGEAMNSIIAQLRQFIGNKQGIDKSMVAPREVEEGFAQLLSHWGNWDAFYQKADLCLLNKNLGTIITQIKNGNKKNATADGVRAAFERQFGGSE